MGEFAVASPLNERGNMEPEVTQRNALDMQVCVPADWTDEQVKTFADYHNLCGTVAGWQIRKEGSPWLAGKPERNPCAERQGFVHVMLDA